MRLHEKILTQIANSVMNRFHQLMGSNCLPYDLISSMIKLDQDIIDIDSALKLYEYHPQNENARVLILLDKSFCLQNNLQKLLQQKCDPI